MKWVSFDASSSERFLLSNKLFTAGLVQLVGLYFLATSTRARSQVWPRFDQLCGLFSAKANSAFHPSEVDK